MKIHCHDDADGLTSALFTSFAINPEKILVKTKFGDISDWSKGDYMVDMRPESPDIEGVVIDHHLDHPDERNYTLIWDDVPATMIAFNTFKEHIPKTQYWKAVIGLGGDAALHLLTSEIIESDPQLRMNVKTSISSKWDVNVHYYPLYRMLSSDINALLRIRKINEALQLMILSERPLDIHENEDVISAKSILKDEVKRVLNSCEVYSIKEVNVAVINTEFKLTGYIATILDKSGASTTIVINKNDRSVSVRGDLALYLKEKLNSLNYIEFSGHPGFMGGHIGGGNVYKLLDDLTQAL